MKKIAVTGAAGAIAYSLLFRLAHGDLFGDKEKISLNLLDIKEMHAALEGVAMELEDCAFPLLSEIKITTDPSVAFNGADVAFLVGAKPRGPGMERSDLLNDNAKIFVEQGRALNEAASRKVKVLVVGNPCNTNCLIAMHHAPNLPRKNFHAMMRLDENRSLALLAKKAGVPVDDIKRLCVWGNHSATQVPDFTNAYIGKLPVLDVIKDRKWLSDEFITTVQKRGAAIIASRGKSSAASAASAAVDAMRSLFIPTPVDNFFTSAVYSDNNPYGIENGLIFGFPCRSNGDGNYEIVSDLELDFFIKERITLTQKELIEERKCVQHLLKTH